MSAGTPLKNYGIIGGAVGQHQATRHQPPAWPDRLSSVATALTVVLAPLSALLGNHALTVVLLVLAVAIGGPRVASWWQRRHILRLERLQAEQARLKAEDERREQEAKLAAFTRIVNALLELMRERIDISGHRSNAVTCLVDRLVGDFPVKKHAEAFLLRDLVKARLQAFAPLPVEVTPPEAQSIGRILDAALHRLMEDGLPYYSKFCKKIAQQDDAKSGDPGDYSHTLALVTTLRLRTLDMLREYNALRKEAAQLGFTLLCPFDLPRWEQELG